MTDPRLPVPRESVAVAQPASRLRKVAILTLGYLFLAFGVVGIALPFLHGLLFLLIGLALLSREVAWAGRMRGWIAERFPRAHDVAVEAEFRAGRWLRRLRARWRRRARR
ncbi:MAG: hypothetical protein L6R19_21010 [Alphaproteobacteria bacterium]|nr:hypothetical protein [Alphaproteobacteria bacterium]